MHGLDKQDLGFILIWIKILSLWNKHNLNNIYVVYTDKVKFQENYSQCIYSFMKDLTSPKDLKILLSFL